MAGAGENGGKLMTEQSDVQSLEVKKLLLRLIFTVVGHREPERFAQRNDPCVLLNVCTVTEELMVL